MSPPPLLARLIGVGKYNEYPHLRPEGDTNAERFKKFLEEEFIPTPDDDIQTVIEDVTREEIFKTFTELRDSIDRNKALLFFFSGYGGGTGGGNSIICPADISVNDKSKGITDQELIRLCDNVSRYRGNNITFLLDCPSSTFAWGNPISFVVIAPSTPLWNRTAFTNAVIDVLRREKELLDFLTVQSFAAKIHAEIGIEVECHGQNIDRLLFNPKEGKAHHVFIPGRAETDNTLTLFAGSAHGVTEGSTFGIYKDHIAHDQSPVGHVKVERVKDSTTSQLCLPNPNFVPPVFYAVETHCLHETVDVFTRGDVGISSPVWNKTKEAEANITLERVDNSDEVKVVWNGNADPEKIALGPYKIPSLSSDELLKVTRRAARFKRIVGSSDNTPSAPLFKVESWKIAEDTDEPTGDDLLQDGLIKLDIKVDKEERICLVIHNVAKFEIWPFVFRCDPTEFTIEPWYTSKQPLASQKQLTIGDDDDDEDSSRFGWKSDPGPGLTYLKIFATKAPTSFLFLTQKRSSKEDKFREVGEEPTAPTDNKNAISEAPQYPSSIKQSDSERRKSDDWQTMLITVRRTYEEKKPTHLRSPKGLRRLALKGWRELKEQGL